MRLIGLNTPLRMVTHWCGNSMYELVSRSGKINNILKAISKYKVRFIDKFVFSIKAPILLLSDNSFKIKDLYLSTKLL